MKEFHLTIKNKLMNRVMNSIFQYLKYIKYDKAQSLTKVRLLKVCKFY